MTNSANQTNLVNELRALGNVYHYQGDFIRAEQHYRLALSLYESCFPDTHEEALLCLLGLVEILESQNKHEEARNLERGIPAMNARRRAC
ncbi:MAG TPA: tetratricopeptide repeat protein [Candidatus Obscuribacterales bacterium]